MRERFWMIVPVCLIIVTFGMLLTRTETSALMMDIENHSERHVIELWLEEEKASGYEDGTFRPDQTVTRAEYVSMLNRIVDISQRMDAAFTDTPQDSWYMDDLERLLATEAVAGYPDNTFRPNELVSRQEAAVILRRLIEWGNVNVASDRPATAIVPDIDQAAAWSESTITWLAANGYVPTDIPFRPTEPLTRAEAVALLDRAYLSRLSDAAAAIQPVFSETFQDKIVVDHKVVDDNGNVIWTINETEGQTFSLADGAMELGGARYMQRLQLENEFDLPDDGMEIEFTVNVQRMGNEGHSGRPMIAVIPRTKDREYEQFYAVTYYMETTYMGNIVANLFKTKWSIVNTASPNGMQPLATGFYMLREHVDYTARLVIRNTDEGHVRIEFFIDGPTDPVKRYEPVVAYTDSSPHRIMQSAAGPAFGMTGRADDFWGPPPIIRYDDIHIMNLPDADLQRKIRKRYIANDPEDLYGHAYAKEIKYLINQGIMEVPADHHIRPDEPIPVQQFVHMLRSATANEQLKSDSDALLTKRAAAEWIYDSLGRPPTDHRYDSILAERPDSHKEDAIHYIFEQGIIGLENSGRFESSHVLTRAEAALLLMRVMDRGYRLPHGDIRLPSILSSGAVLQRDKPIPIWGTATSGETIQVQFRNQVKQTTVEDGVWIVMLDPEPYGGPDPLVISGEADTIELDDIRVGEVFIVAGQSNAEMSVNEVNDTASLFEKYRNSDMLRFYFADQVMAVRPRFDDGGTWNPAYEWAIGYSSAIGTFFVDKLLELNSELEDVPIGIIRTTYGGSTIEVFLPHTFFSRIGFEQQHDEPIMSGYWNGFIHTVAPYAAKAILYYQGENSTQLGYAYESLLREYLSAMREQFLDPELPYFLVQLAGYGDNYYETDIDSWPVIREIQMRVVHTTDHTELVTAVDLSEPDPLEIHPRDKKPIGERLAYRAMESLYGDRSYRDKRSPELAEYELDNGRYTLQFHYVGQGLVLKDAEQSGFEIRDAEGNWLEAQAVLGPDGQQVIVWHDGITDPEGVRYLWRNYPSVTLFDTDGLPVLPFHSEKELHARPPVMTTDEHYIHAPFHFLKDYDGIVNLSRGNAFRMIEARDGLTLWHEFAIDGQTAGDQIALLARLSNGETADGTNERIIRMDDHGLKTGDWIRNNTRGWTPSRVRAVIDEHTVEIETPIPDQTSGDDLERYQLKRIIEAER